jgi:hypothetical protein
LILSVRKASWTAIPDVGCAPSWKALEYADVGQEGRTCIVRGGDPMALVDSATVPLLAKPMIIAGLLTREDAETLQRLYVDQTFYYPFYTLFSAWGRKPVEEGD